MANPAPLSYVIYIAATPEKVWEGFVSKESNRVIFMDQGEIVEDALKADFFGSPRSDRAQKFLSKILSH